jgi:putative ABC transport system permease protein
VGISFALVIILYINQEFSFDRIHSNFDSICRITLHGKLRGIEFEGATTSGKMASYLDAEVEYIDETTRVTRLGAWLINHDSISYNEDNLLFADSNFLSFFDGFQVVEGDISTMLSKPRSIVLTESAANKYFGTTQNLLGDSLLIEAKETPYLITGILKDAPVNSHIDFNMLASLSTYDKLLSSSWASNNIYTYVSISDKSKTDTVLASVNALFEKYILADMVKALDDIFQADDAYEFNLQPLSKIHLHSSLRAELGENSNATYVYSLGIIAFLILIIACLNFMNLSTANSVNRSFEVSLRKVVGADKRYLISQFLVESVVISFLALVVALLLAELLLPVFNSVLNMSLEFGLFENFKSILILLLITLGVGILAGSYPAFFVSSFDPVRVLNRKHMQGLKSSNIRSVFVVIQFFISIVIILLTVVIYTQVNFLMNKDLGFEEENILVVRRSDALKKDIDRFIENIIGNNGVEAAANSNSIPGRDFYLNTFKLKGKQEDAALLFNQLFVNYDFPETFKLELNQGRFFSRREVNDTFSCILNESAAREMGLSYPIGSELIQPFIMKEKMRTYKVIGIVKDFHFQSVDQEIKPLVICLMPGNWEGYLNVRLSSGNQLKTISYIEQEWYKYAPDYPFVYFFLNEDLGKQHNALIRLERVFVIFSILSMLVASLGLYGLLANANNNRYRELGIRKALGASRVQLVLISASESLKLLLVAVIMAWGVAFFIVRFWLSDFYYKIFVGPREYLLALLVVLLLVLPIILYQALKIANKSPAIATSYE